MNNYLQNSLLFLIILSFVSCGGGGSGGSETAPTLKSINISGKIIDGYIKDAFVCLDLNTNGICENNEPNTYSLSDGSYSFNSISLEKTSIIAVISKGGIDTSTNNTYKGELKNIINVVNSSENTNAIITPFTDLFASDYISKKDLSSMNTLKSKITTVFNISNLEADLMQNKSFFIKAQEIELIKNILEISVQKIKNNNSSDEEKRILRNSIKYSIIKNISSSTNNNLDINDTIESIEQDLKISIPQNEKTFIINQISQTKSTLQTVSSVENITSSDLPNIQKELYNELQTIYFKLNNANDTTVLEIDKLNSLRKEISKYLLNLSSPKEKSYETPPFLPSLD